MTASNTLEFVIVQLACETNAPGIGFDLQELVHTITYERKTMVTGGILLKY